MIYIRERLISMCRLLSVLSPRPFDTGRYLDAFARISQASKEFQGHGWGCAWLEGGAWRIYRDIRPVWEDEDRPSPRTHLLLAHARSAFRDEGICIENNMPFADGRYVFIFNGELRGVRIREQGRIGAEKIFNFIKRYDSGDMHEAMEKGLRVIASRSRYVRAMNVILANRDELHLITRFSEDPDYFQLRTRRDGEILLHCSAPFAGEESAWRLVEPDTVHRFRVPVVA